jgi:hypothetical protein
MPMSKEVALKELAANVENVPFEEWHKQLKKLMDTDKKVTKKDAEHVKESVDELVDMFPNMSLTKMKKIVIASWNEKHPNGLQKNPRKPNPYIEFMTDKLNEFKVKHPNMTHAEKMKKISQLWKEEKDKQVPVDIEVDEKEEVAAGKKGRKRKA